MAAKAVQISIDEKLLRVLDRDPETRRRGRSAVVKSALLAYLADKRRRSVDEAIRRAYAANPDVEDDLDRFLAAQAWPDD
jgi:metal-responsive CopG/Arc/MetJ family transcriptional regulator